MRSHHAPGGRSGIPVDQLGEFVHFKALDKGRHTDVRQRIAGTGQPVLRLQCRFHLVHGGAQHLQSPRLLFF